MRHAAFSFKKKPGPSPGFFYDTGAFSSRQVAAGIKTSFILQFSAV